jgi:hypothetical protein
MFAEVKNGAVVTFPYDYDTLVQKNPYTKFGQEDLLSMYSGTEANLSGNSLVKVVEQSQPTFNPATQKVVQNEQPTFVDGVLSLGWTIVDLSAQEQAEMTSQKAKSLRQTRDEKLKETDWMVIRSAETSVALAADWATYRQALRDVTAQTGFPWTITWPDAP